MCPALACHRSFGIGWRVFTSDVEIAAARIREHLMHGLDAGSMIDSVAQARSVADTPEIPTQVLAHL